MMWLAPQYTKSQVDKAGNDLISGDIEAVSPALPIVENWRRAHNFPLTAFLATLRHKAKSVDEFAILAQRIKRMTSIESKLKRYRSTRLTQMQDIGGCRAVMTTLDQARELLQLYKNEDAAKPDKERGKIIDYIQKPKSSGYRGIHIVYKYAGQKTAYRGLNIEIQIRSLKQHAWATAVETVGIFTHSALKSSKGNPAWLRFFAVMGTIIAGMEGCPAVPNTPPLDEVTETLLYYIKTLDALESLRTFGSVVKEIRNYQQANDRFFLLELSPGTKQLEVRGYRKEQFRKASQDYDTLESEVKGSDRMVVLVSVGAIAELRRAYPNYYLDTSAFVDLVEQAVDNKF